MPPPPLRTSAGAPTGPNAGASTHASEYADFESFSPIMTRDEMLDWFSRRLGRAADAADVFKVGKEFYQLGAYSRALVCLQHYVAFPGAITAGRHLLAYCYLSLGELENALIEFKACVLENFHEDWQMVVELAIEIEEARRQQAANNPRHLMNQDLLASTTAADVANMSLDSSSASNVLATM
ncbi:hypothetical protein AMAG_08309 [Allomyces macrogynus ATCC 38327]|uniref:Uncharacterized protein n=1 Tax=Allomyces macrogynus (strain ATCC 38327) TaxID=578462 RepID=A0A0L0SKU2_ALLM3|nr:hypothetical protein AMAG_08309 [Allomyces macrogynus ATCC 38327]|eukprot:KNE63147.1 hypothetical protein AMAG_08309 [Allomyces macrogynus ATCC 38327]